MRPWPRDVILTEDLAIPCLFMRGGTSRGPFFKAADLPDNRDEIAEILLDVMGRGGPPQPDGLGGTASVTNKAAILSVEAGVVQYLFAQIVPDEARVDFSPNCGNMLIAVGPAAIEMGLVPARDGETVVDIVNINTGTRAQSVVQTPDGKMTYVGDVSIDGVPGTAAPILVNFVDPDGTKTSGLLPTGKTIEKIDGCEVSLIDCAMPMMWARASDLGVAIPPAESLDHDADLMARLEAMRIEAGHRMGLGDCSNKVIPKMGLVAEPSHGGTVAVRYFTPKKQHPTCAFSGAVCAASLCSLDNTVVTGLEAEIPSGDVLIEHPSGEIDITIQTEPSGKHIGVVKAGSVRTARLIMRGEVFVPPRSVVQS